MLCSFFFPSLQTPQAVGAVFCQDPASEREPGFPLALTAAGCKKPKFLCPLHCLEASRRRSLPIPDESREQTTLYSAAAVRSDAKQFAHLPAGSGNPVIPEQGCIAPATVWLPSAPSQHRPQKPQVPMKSYSTRVVQFIVHHLTV